MRFFFIILVLLFLSCTSKIAKEDLGQLNGYWEIEEVVFPDGTTKSYSINETIDFIQLKETSGFRKKVRPQFDGSYKVSADAEPFTILEKQGVFSLKYSNELSEWQEELTAISKNKFSVVNEENITYHYKRHQPLLENK